MKKLGALWTRESKGGDRYMSGVLEDMRGEIRIVVFKNGKKEKDNHPDFLIYLSEDKEEKRKDAEPIDIFGKEDFGKEPGESNIEEEINLEELGL